MLLQNSGADRVREGDLFRHCERSEAIQLFSYKVWIASSLRFSQ